MQNTRWLVRLVVVAALSWPAVEALAAPRWGDITPKQCLDGRKREYSAILWDIPWGVSWEKTCQNTPGSVAGQRARTPDRCVIGVNVWGVWEIEDASCGAPPPASGPRWGDITPKQCVRDGIREYSGILWDIPWGASWEIACRDTPASVAGQRPRTPDTCTKGANMWGIWWVRDDACRSKKPKGRRD